MRVLYEIRDTRPMERTLYILIGILALAGGSWFLLGRLPLLRSGEADVFRIGAAGLIALLGLLALFRIPQAVLRAYRYSLLFEYGIWPISIFRRVRIPCECVTLIKVVEHDPVEYPVGWGVRGERVRLGSRWSLRGTRYGRGVLIASTKGDFVLSCRNPEEAAYRLRKIAGLE
jgi:hypothetical protein